MKRWIKQTTNLLHQINAKTVTSFLPQRMRGIAPHLLNVPVKRKLTTEGIFGGRGKNYVLIKNHSSW